MGRLIWKVSCQAGVWVGCHFSYRLLWGMEKKLIVRVVYGACAACVHIMNANADEQE
jgi:hypothetical protein